MKRQVIPTSFAFVALKTFKTFQNSKSTKITFIYWNMILSEQKNIRKKNTELSDPRKMWTLKNLDFKKPEIIKTVRCRKRLEKHIILLRQEICWEDILSKLSEKVVTEAFRKIEDVLKNENDS